MLDTEFSNLRILVVDDQEDVRDMMRAFLTGFGVTQIFEASDGKAALSFFSTSEDGVDLIICDWNMPEMSGVELLKQLRVLDPDVPFLMVTGRSDMESVVEAKSSGVAGYIRKPFLPSALEAKIRILLFRMAA